LVSYLIKTQPGLIDVKAANGVTPLFLACRLGRLAAVKMLIRAGADQATKDQGRNTLLHAVLDYCPGVDELKQMFELLDREALIPMVKERNRLEEGGGRTPLHQYVAGAASHRGKYVHRGIAVIKALFDLSPENAQQALKMLDGTGDTPLHTLLAKDADPALVKAIIDFDPTLLCCENAVGRTPAEVAHDRYLSDNIKAPTRSRYRPDDSVTSLVSAFAGGFAKPVSTDNEAKEQEPKEHEPKTAVAKNWRLCAEIMARDGQPKRTLVSLNSANFVAKRLGQQHMRDRYRFGVVKTDGEDAPEPTAAGSEDGDSAAGKDESAAKTEPETAAASAEKTKRRRTDVITSRYGGSNSAWARPKKAKKAEGGKEEKEENGNEEEDGDDDDNEL
jgi:hypothetical protein